MQDSLDKIRKVILEYFNDYNCRIFLFGSRARGDNYKFSDIDVGIISDKEIDSRKLTLLREKLEDMNVPNKIELVDFCHVSEDFKKEALKQIVIWKD